jgi:hypothetical protein
MKLMKTSLIILTIIFAFSSCEKDYNAAGTNHTQRIELEFGKCYTDENRNSFCFDELMEDSRCPMNANCVWEGNAKIRLSLKSSDDQEHSIELNTNSNFTIDTIVGDFYILLNSLSPYPNTNENYSTDDYKATITISDISKQESNAQIIGFNADKCSCCWGWTIKMGNDTIQSDNWIIGHTIGYTFNEPVDVYIEKGKLSQICSSTSKYDYYDLNLIVRTPN